MTEPKMITDMNDRERQRFVEGFGAVEESSRVLRVALQEGDDNSLGQPALLFMFAFTQLKDFFEILSKAQFVNTDDLDQPREWPDPSEKEV